MKGRTALPRAALPLLGLLFSGAAHAQVSEVERLHVDGVVAGASGAERVDVYLRAETRYGEPVASIDAGEVRVRDNGRLVDPSKVVVLRLADANIGAAFVVAIDASRTMQGEPFARARKAIHRLVERAGPSDRLAIVAFSSHVEVVAPLQAPGADLLALLDEVEVERKELTTLLFDGAHKAVELLRWEEAPPSRSFVIVFSDGKDEGSRATLGEVVDLARGAAAQSRIPIFAVGFDRFGGGSLKALLDLSRATEAEAFFAQSSDLIPSYFDEIQRLMMHSYVIRYPAEMDGGRHAVEVAIGGRAETVSTTYPDIGSGRALWWGAGALLVAGLAGLLWVRRTRPAGRLIFLDGDRKGEVVSLHRPRLSIGALPDNDIVVPSQAVSRYHAQIHCRGRHVEVKDVGSSNGTFVNGTAIRSCPLEPGDRLRVGDVDLVFEQ